MKLFTDAEVEEVGQTIYADLSASPLEVMTAAALSHLCEPGDMFLGHLAELLGQESLLEALVNRWDVARVSNQLGEESTVVEEHYEQPLAKLWSNASERWLPRLNKSQVLSSLSEFGQTGGQVLSWTCSSYPSGLNDLHWGRPPLLWLKGKISLLGDNPRVSVVGTRSSNRYGTQMAADIATVCVQNGIATVSGGAFGIDSVVHQTALRLEGPTIAILAGGLANLYPKSNLPMLTQIGDSGLLLAEQPPNTTPSKWRFLMRNRLIAALGDATIIVQAGRTSGALSTGNHAVSIMRPVAVVPGPVDSPFSVGCHDFLNANLGSVQLLARPQDVTRVLGMAPDELPIQGGLGSLEKRALDSFTDAPMETWQVQRLAGLTIQETQIALGSLVLTGHVERVGSRFLRASK